MAAAKFWMGPNPSQCDICSKKIVDKFFDGKTKMGPWACMCPDCHKTKGCGLGMGRGQEYTLQASGEHAGKWLKTGG